MMDKCCEPYGDLLGLVRSCDPALEWIGEGDKGRLFYENEYESAKWLWHYCPFCGKCLSDRHDTYSPER